jgi:hypothetical protein
MLEQDNEDSNDFRIGERFVGFDLGSLTIGAAPTPVAPDKSN